MTGAGLSEKDAEELLCSIWSAEQPYAVLEHWVTQRSISRWRHGWSGYQQQDRLELTMFAGLLTLARHATLARAQDADARPAGLKA